MNNDPSMLAALLVLIHRQNDLIEASKIAADTVGKMSHVVNLLIDSNEAQSNINSGLMKTLDVHAATLEEHQAAHEVFRTVINEQIDHISRLRKMING